VIFYRYRTERYTNKGLMLNKLKSFFLAFLFFALIANGTLLSLDKYPKRYQLFPRGKTDSALVTLSGFIVPDSGSDSLHVTLSRNGLTVWSNVMQIDSSMDTVNFSFTPAIAAEKASYDISLSVDTTILFSADSLVCGDVILINGQSNAFANSGGYPQETSPWFRTFGSMQNDKDDWGADTVWCNAHNKMHSILGSVGEWGLRLGLKLVSERSVPVCIINGAVSGTFIEEHFPDPDNRENLQTIYGRLLNRCKRAGVADAVSGFVWYQGEHHSDSLYMKWGAMWDSLRAEWKKDYSAIELIVVCQIRHGCGHDHQDFVRNEQRLLAERHREVRLITASDLPEHDGCHYGTNGYFALGDRIFNLFSSELYGVTFVQSQTAPRLLKSFFATKSQKHLLMEFDQPVNWQNEFQTYKLKDMFYFEDTSIYVDTGFAVGNIVQINLNKRCTIPEITYTPNIYYPGTSYLFNGPFIVGSGGQNALTFYKQPITNSPDTVPLLSIRGVVYDSVEQYGKLLKFIYLETENYMGEWDTVTTGFTIKSLDTFLLVNDSMGTLFGRNRGLARVEVRYRGFIDTVSVKVVATTALLDSLALILPRHWILEKDTMKVTAVAYYHTQDTFFTAQVDTSVLWFVPDSIIASVDKGILVVSGCDSVVELTVTLGQVSVSAQIDVLKRPEFIKRIRFQNSTLPERMNWTNDSGKTYSIDNGMGWLGNNRFFMDAPQGSMLLRISLLPTEDVESMVIIGTDTINFTKYNGRMVATESLHVSVLEGFLIKTEDKLDYIVAVSVPLATDFTYLADDGYVSPETNIAETSLLLIKPGLLCSPNPANPNIELKWQLHLSSSSVNLAIINTSGRVVRKWMLQTKNEKKGTILWDGRDNYGKKLSSGLYFVKLESEKIFYMNRIVLLH
jgi:hypothetical protein